MHVRIANIVVLAAVTVVGPAAAAGAPANVDFELLTDRGFPIGGERQWIEVLKSLDVGAIRIRQAGLSDIPQITNRGSERSPRYLVVGLLTDRNTLVLPGGKFSLRDKRPIRDWIEKLQAGGEDELYAERGAFGLTAKELVEVHNQLAAPVAGETKDQPAGEVVQRIAASLPLEVEFDGAARRALALAGPLTDDLKGMSGGAALAIALRPAGLAMTVDKPLGGEPKLRIASAGEVKEAWPVGWPMEDSLRQVMPKMLTFLSIEINNIPLSDALAALSKRLEAPLLFDHNALAQHRINPAEIAVSLPQGRTYYKAAIDKLLFQARLKEDIRVDEAGKPFVWITTIKN